LATALFLTDSFSKFKIEDKSRRWL